MTRWTADTVHELGCHDRHDLDNPEYWRSYYVYVTIDISDREEVCSIQCTLKHTDEPSIATYRHSTVLTLPHHMLHYGREYPELASCVRF